MHAIRIHVPDCESTVVDDRERTGGRSGGERKGDGGSNEALHCDGDPVFHSALST